MSYLLRFLPEVEGDVVAASRWYEEKSPDSERTSFVTSFHAPGRTGSAP